MKQERRNAKAVKLAKRLNSDNRSWREIALDYPPIVKAGTLNRIAKSGGAYVPQNQEICKALGIIVEPRRKRIFNEKPVDLLWRLNHRVVMGDANPLRLLKPKRRLIT